MPDRRAGRRLALLDAPLSRRGHRPRRVAGAKPGEDRKRGSHDTPGDEMEENGRHERPPLPGFRRPQALGNAHRRVRAAPTGIGIAPGPDRAERRAGATAPVRAPDAAVPAARIRPRRQYGLRRRHHPHRHRRDAEPRPVAAAAHPRPAAADDTDQGCLRARGAARGAVRAPDPAALARADTRSDPSTPCTARRSSWAACC